MLRTGKLTLPAGNTIFCFRFSVGFLLITFKGRFIIMEKQFTIHRFKDLRNRNLLRAPWGAVMTSCAGNGI